jgi:hypothetical protein
VLAHTSHVSSCAAFHCKIQVHSDIQTSWLGPFLVHRPQIDTPSYRLSIQVDSRQDMLQSSGGDYWRSEQYYCHWLDTSEIPSLNRVTYL